MKKRLLALTMTAILALSLAACGPAGIQAEDLTAGVQGETPVVDYTISQAELESQAITDFSLELFQRSIQEGRSTMVSPLSALYALAMTANGGAGETLAQMEEMFGLPVGSLNEYLYLYHDALPQGDAYRLDIANSIWLKDDESLQVREDFLKTNATWYASDIYKAPFDESTVKDINAWVEEKTNGLIPNALDKLSPGAVFCLVNALYFDAEWNEVYQDTQLRDGPFTTEDGQEQTAEFMHSTEDLYLEDENATGVVRFYDDHAYAFVGLLPKEGVKLQEYIDALTGQHLRDLLLNPVEAEVWTKLPKFETQSSIELNDVLMAMGMTDAFDPILADFSAMADTGTGQLYIERVFQKTVIAVDERGTEAGAVTIVEPAEGAAMPPEEIKEVYLDRPFLYLIVDWENRVPIFVGTLTEVDE